ncbi:conserved hypothetical protein [Halorhabdus utahensis DSM 12940]|uniref:O-methyltransferase-like protein n=1 Tax=Halorhabdus utahensis (strain DSM 12940 / JCM 11049 / AX-2) TaxID=519442 RepID=C7NM93_HALUD|nr:class I SAM-dependent methyltransferase [Halorhabdus utahensis]ACV11301.1 conserved hypothetical protein [Halorhabdus utahensis DSM 12940]
MTESAVLKAIQSPSKIPSHIHDQIRKLYRRRHTHPAVIEMVSGVLEEDHSVVREYYNGLKKSKTIIESVKSTGDFISHFAVPEHALLFYLTCRAVEPEIVVETGVHTGTSSVTILQALADNGHGKLHSIDLPGTKRDPIVDSTSPYGTVKYELSDKSEVGEKVPESLRDNWELHLGSSDEILEPLLTDIGPIDIFCHDSDHSYENMMFEFNTAQEHLHSEGVVLSDDVDWNDAFMDFTNKYASVSDSLDDYVPDRWMKETTIAGIGKL